MSQLVAGAFPLLAASDGRCVVDEYADDNGIQPAPMCGLLYTSSDFLGLDDWTSDWWPNSGTLLGDTGLSDVQRQAVGSWQRVYPSAGCNGRLSFSGTSRDQYGSPAPNCTVRCYRVSTGELISQVTSDVNGAFIATSPYSEAHFLTVHRTGPPDIAGATVDTLIPS